MVATFSLDSGVVGYTQLPGTMYRNVQHAMADLDAPSCTPPRQNLMIVSNRLPVNVTRDKKTGCWALPMSPGGLVSALLSVSQVLTLRNPGRGLNV
jgi:hypothetical protein